MIKEWTLKDIEGRKIWFPYMYDAAFVLAATFRNMGYDSEVLPRSDDPLFSLSRKYTDGDQCLPSIITTEDILKRVFSPDFNPEKEAFFQGKTGGPCRFGRYYMNQELILESVGMKNVPIFTLGSRNLYGGMGTDNKILAWDGVIAQAILERKLNLTRPLEVTKGKSREVYEKYLKNICNFTEKGISGSKLIKNIKILTGNHNKGLLEILREAYDEFSKIKTRQERKPVILVTGEIFVRVNSVANQDIIEKIENLGGIALLEQPQSFLSVVNETKIMKYENEFKQGYYKNILNWLHSKLQKKVIEKDEHKITDIFDVPEDPLAEEIIKRGSGYIHPSYEGEAIITLGTSDYFASLDELVDGIINTMPFNCMPGMIVSSKSMELRKNYNNFPFLNLSYDGNIDSSRDEQLEVFMYQVKERMA